MVKKYSLLIEIVVAFTLFTGCAVSRLQKDYGNSYRLTKSNQTLNPEAGKNLEPVYGFDGIAAHKIVEKYRKGFEKTEEKPDYTLRTMDFLTTGDRK